MGIGIKHFQKKKNNANKYLSFSCMGLYLPGVLLFTPLSSSSPTRALTGLLLLIYSKKLKLLEHPLHFSSSFLVLLILCLHLA